MCEKSRADEMHSLLLRGSDEVTRIRLQLIISVIRGRTVPYRALYIVIALLLALGIPPLVSSNGLILLPVEALVDTPKSRLHKY